MALFQKFDQYIEDLHRGYHHWDTIDNGGSQYCFCLLSADNAPSGSTHAVLADLTPVDLTNMPSGSDNYLTITSAEQTGGVFQVFVEDRLVTADGGDIGPFRYVVLYKQSESGEDGPTDPLVCFWDFRRETTLSDGESFPLDFSDTDGLFAAGWCG